jgi:hypothetical protein
MKEARLLVGPFNYTNTYNECYLVPGKPYMRASARAHLGACHLREVVTACIVSRVEVNYYRIVRDLFLGMQHCSIQASTSSIAYHCVRRPSRRGGE